MKTPVEAGKVSLHSASFQTLCNNAMINNKKSDNDPWNGNDPWEKPHSFLYDLVQFTLILIYIAPVIALSVLVGYSLVSLQNPDGLLIEALQYTVIFISLLISASLCHNAKKHADWLMTRNKKKHNQQVDPIVKTPVDKVEAQGTQGHP